MGDRAWAQLTLYEVGGPKEVEALCSFIEEHLSSGYSRITELEIDSYDESEVSLGLVEEAESLAEDTPNSIWVLYQAGYDGAGEVAYHLPGLGVWRCSEDGEPVFSRTEVIAMFAMKPAERMRALGTPWIETFTTLAKTMNSPEQRPCRPRPTPDEVEEWENDDAAADTTTA